MRFCEISTGLTATVTERRSIFRRPALLLLLLLSMVVLIPAARAKAQLPDAPSASAREIAPLRRYSLSVGLENTYSFSTSVLNLTSKVGVSIRIGERETVGVSYSHATALNQPFWVQNNTMLAYLNFRALSWGKIPR